MRVGDVVFVLTAGRAAERRVNGVSVVEFEDAMERYRKRRLTAEGKLGLLRESVLHASACRAWPIETWEQEQLVRLGGHDGCRFGRVF